MISSHVEEFAGLPVEEFQPDGGIHDPAGRAWRLSVDYDAAESGATFQGVFERFLADPACHQVKALVIGDWGSAYDTSNSSAHVVAALADARDRLPALRAVFLCDITYEESEISWIGQSDVTPLLQAYPDLEWLQVRGGSGLVLAPGTQHDRLRTLVIQTGGLPAEVVRAISESTFPNLEHLELWLGEENYGGNTTVADLGPILSGKSFPKLKYLGLCDSEIADQVAAALGQAPVVGGLDVLDLSLGNLSDEGAVALLQNESLASLKKLDLHHHYVSDEVLDGLLALGIELDATDRQEPHTYQGEIHRYISVSE